MSKVKETAATAAKTVAKETTSVNSKNVEQKKEKVMIDSETTETEKTDVVKREKRLSKSPAVDNYPKHIVELALIIKNNAEIRRFTAIGIINYLLQKGEIKGKSRYVSFKWNKFAVKCDGLMREYPYTEKFFLNALVASFASFSASAQRTIDTFCRTEYKSNIAEVCDKEAVDSIIDSNETYQEKESVTE